MGSNKLLKPKEVTDHEVFGVAWTCLHASLTQMTHFDPEQTVLIHDRTMFAARGHTQPGATAISVKFIMKPALQNQNFLSARM